MASQQVVLVCAECEVAAKGVLEEDGPVLLRCPSCDHTEELETARCLAQRYLASQAPDHIRGVIRDATCGSKVLKDKHGSGSRPIRPRFIYG